MSFDFDKHAYPETFIINEKQFQGTKKTGNNQVKIPFTVEPDVDLGTVIIQKIGQRDIFLKVVDLNILLDSTMQVGTTHPHLLSLEVENISSEKHKQNKGSNNVFNIGHVSGSQVQIGESNHLLINVSITELVEKVAASEDPNAKSALKELLNNSTVASIIGAGASALVSML
ncbi:hypothetical protein [Enterobacter asburiae]|uniref:hypothetical protein n=1 Tax=Enterobacter asburiae TaxID=61645 RepID=UPI00192B0A70|nr:hypothetical protein [Enterobacter asburiae]MBL5926608.1 hypothetical protein [Enterobacter asburiae]MBL5957394.1 hypothetical protein [Enterobacter asburiae]